MYEPNCRAKWTFWGSRGGSHITKWLPGHKNGLNWPKQRPSKITPKIARFDIANTVREGVFAPERLAQILLNDPK